MLTTTEAIVLYLQPYTDKAQILHTYTRTEGRINFMVYGSARKNNTALYMPMSLVEVTADIHASRQMPTLRQARLLYIPQQMAQDIRRQTVALFLAEVLFRTLKHPLEDATLFDYLVSVVKTLDTTAEPENLHIRFLINLATYIGFGIDEEKQPELLKLPATRRERQTQLQNLCNYFQNQIDDWQQPRSLDILMQLFD